MPKFCLAYYGDDPYNHDKSLSEWGRYYLKGEDDNAVLERQTQQLEELFRKKRIAWYKVIVLDLTEAGDSFEVVAAKYHPLRHKIILNEEAKLDVENRKKEVKFQDLWNPAIAPQAVVDVPVGINMWGDIVGNNQ
jgi:hypothetical protein